MSYTPNMMNLLGATQPIPFKVVRGAAKLGPTVAKDYEIVI